MNILRRYQGGGFGNAGLNYSSSFSNPSSTGWKAPGNAPGGLGFGNASLNSASLSGTGTTKQGSGFDANQAMNYGTAALGAITGAINTSRQAKAEINMMNEANRMGREQNLASAKSRVQNMRTSGNQYGTYGTMYGQYGGAVLGYENESAMSPGNAEGGLGFGGASLEYGASNPGLAEAAGAAGIGRGISDAFLTNVPGWGQAYGAAKLLSTGIQNAYGTEWRETESGDIREVYGSEGDTSAEVKAKGALGNLWKPAHEHAMESFERGDIGEGILDLTGLSTIGRMVEGASDAEDARLARIRFNKENSRTQGGTTGGTHLNNQQLAMNAMQDRQIPTAKYGGMMPEYKSGGYRVEKSDDRKGKTHKVTGPDGSVKYFGDPNLGERSKSKYGKEAFYSRHKKNLDANPHFRAYARATWETGGMYPDTPEMGMGGYMDAYKGGGLYANIHAKRERIKAGSGESMRSPGSEGAPTDKAFTDSAKTAKMGMGGYMKYADGGIHINPSKRGTFKAQATKMNMGVQEAADKILSAPEETYLPEMRKKANFARNFAKKYGGMMEYQTGGMSYSEGVKRSNANAELEDNEIVMKKGGSRDIKIDGPTHEQGGVPMKLEKGDYVWSDHLKDPQSGMSMAELYERLSKNGASEAEIQQLMMYQEQLAGRVPGQGMEQTAKSGGLMKYKTAGPFPKFNRTFNMFEDRPMGTGSVVTMKGMPVSPEIAALVQKKTPEIPTQKKASTASKPKAPASSTPAPPAVPSTKKLEGYPHHEFPLKEAQVNRTGYDNPESRLSTYTAPEKSRPNYLKYGPELLSAASAIAAMAATAGQDFNKVPIPQAQRVKADKMFLDRMSPDAELARSQRDFAAMMAANLKMGQGPGASSTIQSAYSDKVRADEQARANADRLNIQIDATEKAGNIDSKMKADMFNEENAARYREMAFAQDTASEAFEREKTQALVAQGLQGAQTVANTAMNRRYAEALSGESGVLERDQKKALKAFYINMGFDVPDYLTA